MGIAKSATKLAAEILAAGEALEDLRVHDFKNDAEAHDDKRIDKLCDEFVADLDSAAAELSAIYGPPALTGKADYELIPLNGVFRYAMWQVDHQVLFLAAAQEDRGPPILLMLGSVVGEVM